MGRVAIIAAMAGELKPLVRAWQHERRNSVDLWRWQFDEGEWVASCAGAGASAGTWAFAEIERDGPIDEAISTGWAGALSDQCKPGETYHVSEVIDARTGERFRTAIPEEEYWLVTSPKVANHAEKQRLAATYQASMVDMEGAVVARLAKMRGIPFYCLKGVSDGFTAKLPDFNRFISPSGQFQMGKFILFVLLRPTYWPGLIQMGENSRKASQNIRESVLEILDPQGTIRKRNGYPNLKY